MSKYKKDISNTKVSALDSALKLLMDVYKKTRYFLGCLLIDNLLRSIVHWYDKRHPNSKKKEFNNSEEVIHLNERITTLLRRISELESSVKILKANESSLKSQKESILAEIKSKDNELSRLINEHNQMISQIAELRNENQKLLQRCLPETEIPSMIYYAQGDASGLYLRKLSTERTSEHIYKMTTFAGDTTSAIFEPYLETNIQEIINNRNLTLIACEIMRIEPNASRIQVCEAGMAKCENNKWKVINKAKIILS